MNIRDFDKAERSYERASNLMLDEAAEMADRIERELDVYEFNALSLKDMDFTIFDPDRTSLALWRIHCTIQGNEYPDEKLAIIRSEISEVLSSAAHGHVERLMRNGML